jgi:hypothetical protein
MTEPCLAVHRRYAVETVAAETLQAEGSSALVYAPGPYRVGFFRLRGTK